MAYTEIFKGKVPVYSWSPIVEESCLKQAIALSNHPKVVDRVCLMADTHAGVGMPIGGVIGLDNAVIPNAVGVDIGCFTGDTLIPLPSGEIISLREFQESGEKHWVYTVRDGQVSVAMAVGVKTREMAELVEVVLDSGEKIICTPDQKFMKRDGVYTEAENLTAGESLMPLYTKQVKDGHIHVFQPDVERWLSFHCSLARQGLLGRWESKGGKIVIHHKNIKPYDNRPENLQFMSLFEHTRYHQELARLAGHEHWNSPGFKLQRKEAYKKKAETLEGRDYFSKRGTQNIMKYMRENKEHFKNAVSGNGERGKGYLVGYNQSEKGRQKSSEMGRNNLTREMKCGVCGEVAVGLNGVRKHRKEFHNHKVVSVIRLERREDVYCLKVEGTHNFAIAQGVFVHNCGMSFIDTGIPADSVSKEKLTQIGQLIMELIPVGVGGRRDSTQGERLLRETQVFQTKGYLKYGKVFREFGEQLVQDANSQVGTLGSGNHFIELQKSNEGNLCVMIHSGSRNIGHQVASHFDKVAQDECAGMGVDSKLSFLEVGGVTKYGDAYVDFMELALEFAYANRIVMMRNVVDAMKDVRVLSTIFQIKERLDIHHNYANKELVLLSDGSWKYLWVHRKGAVRARLDDKVIVPGAMGISSYILKGLGNTQSMSSCSHGAGRVMSRSAAKKQFDDVKQRKALEDRGVIVMCNGSIADEVPGCYKNIDDVISNQSDLVEPVLKLETLLVVKGA